jgi:peptidoglycan/LPS O-acetylase OafA/YrhL
MFFICILPALAAAVVVNRAVEKPFLQLRERVLNRKAK